MNEQDSKWLYGKMRSKGIDTGTYDEFKSSLANKQDRDWYYKKSKEFGLNVGSPQQFDDLFAYQQPKPNLIDKAKDWAEKKVVQAGKKTETAPVNSDQSASVSDPLVSLAEKKAEERADEWIDRTKKSASAPQIMPTQNLHEHVSQLVNEPYQMGQDVPKVLTPESVRVQRMGTEERVNSALKRVDTEDVAAKTYDDADRRATQKFLDETRGSFAPVEWQGTQALAAHLSEHDLRRMADEAWNRLGQSKQTMLINDIYEAYKKEYPSATEEQLQTEARNTAKSLVDRRMYDEAVKRNAPKDAAELFLRKLQNTSMGSLRTAAARSMAGTTGDLLARDAAEAEFEKNHKAAGIAGSVMSVAADPVTWLSGGAGTAAGKGAVMGAGKVLGEQAARKFSTELGGRLAQGVIGGGVNFATFESATEALSQLKYGGTVRQDMDGGVLGSGMSIGDYSAAEIGKKALHGAATGAAVGVVAPFLGNASDKLVRATNSTAGKVGIRAGELGVGTVAEGTIFAVPELVNTYRDFENEIASLSDKTSKNYIADEKERERKIANLKEKRGDSLMDVWGDNMAMIAGFKLHGLVKSAPDRIREIRSSGKGKAGFETRLRNALDGKEGLSLTEDEKQELQKGGYADLKELTEEYQRATEELQKEKKNPENINPARMIGKGTSEELPYNRFVELMNDQNISEAARAKMYYYVTGNALPMSTVMGYTMTENYGADGKPESYTVTSNGKNGVITSRTFTSQDRANTEVQRILRQAELNTIDLGEQFRDYVADVRRTDEAIDVMAEDFGIGKDALRELLRKSPETLTEQERHTLEILENYKRDTQGKYDAASMRAEVGENYGVDVDKAIKKEPLRRTENEKIAVEEYVKKLYEGVEIGEQERESGPVDETVAADPIKQIKGSDGRYEERTDSEPVETDRPTVEQSNNTSPSETQPSADPLSDMVKDRTHKQTGNVIPVRLFGTQGNFFLKDGNVVTLPNGRIDTHKSSSEIIVIDNDGNTKMLSPDAIEEIGIGILPSDYLEQERLRQDALQNADTVTPAETADYAVGDGITLPDGRNGEIFQKRDDGTYDIAVMDDRGNYAAINLTKEELDNAEIRPGQYTTTEETETQTPVESPTSMPQDDSQTEQAPAPQPAETPADTPTARYRQISDRYGEKTGHKIDVTLRDRTGELNKTQKALQKAQQAFDDAPIGKEEKAEKALEKARKAYEEAKAELDSWKAVKEEHDKIVQAEAKARAEQDALRNEQAVEEERQRQAEEIAKREEQAERGAHAVHPAIREKWDAAPKIEGAENEITLANGERVKGRYVLVESGAATPSHNPSMEFVPYEGFPVDENGQTVNDRDYERDKEAQDITRQTGANYDSRALQSVPVVSNDGVVLSGNGRTMAGELAARDNTDGAYIDHLRKYPQQFGFTSEQVDGMQHPRVLFVPDEPMPYTTETFAKFNQQDMKSQSRTEQSVKLGKTVDDATFNRVIRSINSFDTIGDFYNDTTASTEAISELRNAGAINSMQYAEMFDGEKISGIGRQMLENMLIGKAFESNPDAIRQLAEYPSMRQSVISALAEISTNVGLGEEYSLESELAEAISLAYQARKNGYKAGDLVSDYARQLNLFPFDMEETVADYTNATVLMLADVLNDNRVSMLKKALTMYNHAASESASGQMDIFSGSVKDRKEIIKDVLNTLNYGTQQEQQAALTAAAEQRKAEATEQSTSSESLQQDGTTSAVDSGSEDTGRSERNEEEIARLTHDEAITLIAQMEKRADVAPDVELTIENWDAQFGEDGRVNTPIGDVKMGENQFTKLMRQGREGKLGMIKPTLETPDVIIEDASEAKEDDVAERNSSYVFVKAFKKADGSRYYYFTSVTVSKDGKEVVISNQEKRKNAIANLLTNGKLVWKHADDVSAASDVEQGLYSSQGNMSDPTTEGTDAPQTNVISVSKDSENSASVQEKTEKVAENQSPSEPNAVQSALAVAEQETNTEPTEAQKEAGNYKKGHVKIDGYDVTIENPKGSVRRGTDASGKQWEQEMQNTYGYIRGTEGVDGDHIDVFFSDDPSQGDVFVVDQVNKDGSFDEHKVMYGFPDIESARKAYLSNYEDGWQGLGAITPVSKEEFKKWIDSSHRKTKPFAEYSSVKPLGDTQLGEQPNKPTVKAGEDYVSAAERIAKEHEVKHTAAHFAMETREEAAAFDKRVPKMDDAELLAYMQADGKGDMNKAHHPSVYDEYDYRHGDEQLQSYDDTLVRLNESSTTLEQAEEMLANIHGDMELLATEERPLLLGQEEALQEYIDRRLYDEAKGDVSEPQPVGKGLFSYFNGTIKELISEAKKKGNALVKKIISPVSSRLQEDLSSQGLEVGGYNHVLDNSAIRHTLKQHGGEDEVKRGQIPITEEDFDRLPDVVENYDDVRVENGKRDNIDNIIYSKSYPDGTTIYVEEKRDKRKELAAVTMWKTKNTTLTDANRDATPISDLSGVVSADKGTDLFGNEQGSGKIDDVGEVLAGARKDMRREIAESLANVTEAALVEKPFGKVYKKPDLKKAVESGALREKDAIFYEAFFSMVNQQKPKVTQSEVRSKRYIPGYKTKAERWASDTFKQMEVLRQFMELDEAGRDTMMERMLADRYPTREQELAEIEKRKSWNPDYEGHKYEWGDKTTPNPLWVTHEVMNRLGYSVGDKLDVPYGVVKANTSGTGYSIENLKGERASLFGSGMTLDEAIDRIVYLAKLKRGDADVSHPTQLFAFPATKSEIGESGRYRVMWGRDYKTREFDSKEDADAFAQTKNGAYVSPIMETKRRFGYKVRFTHPLTGEKMFVDNAEFDTKDEAQAYFDGNFEKLNEATNAKLQDEREKKGEKKTLTAEDVVHVQMIHSKDDGWKYAVVIDKKYANNDGMVHIIKEGFASRKDAETFADGVKDEVLKTVLKHKEDAKKIVYFDTGENSRIGEDYRNGKNVDAEDFMNTFGFRGVQFGNWTNQADRQMAVNQAYDAFMDMARLIGVSPKAMSLNGELGIAFGARGVGGFAAHYEPGEVVINLTKTHGAGSLAHEWWHALDNYFARRAGSAGDMVTDNRRIEMRDALRKAFNDMLSLVNSSDYAQRSAAKGEYWGRTHEITARLLAEWVDRELKKRGELNTFLSRGAVVERGQQHNYDVYEALERLAGREPMPFEEYKELPESLKGIPYPSAKEVEQFGGALRHIFDTLEEKVDEETGNVMLYEPTTTYETRDGKKVVWRSLFDDMGVRSSDEVAKVSQHTGQEKPSDVAIAPSEIRLRKLKKGETCHVERVYEETKQFDFTGKEKVESAEDVAYIFRQLENAAVENSFLVLVKDGKPTVIHLGVGSYVGVMAPYEQALVAYSKLKPEQVYFVHNHPSGTLKASRQDQDLLNRIKRAFGENVVQQGIIIDTTSGNYGEFESIETAYETYSVEEEMPQSQGGEVPVKVYQFSRQVFAPDWNPESAFKIVSSQSVAEFVSSHRLGEHKKMSFLVVNNNGNVVANVFLPWTKLSDIKRRKDAGDLLAGYVHQCGGVRGVLYGNYDYEPDDQKVLASVGLRMRQLNAPLLDALHVEHSAFESGWDGVGEPMKSFGGNSGYVGYSKSKRAVEAEERGLRNKSQMNKDFAEEVNRLIQEQAPGTPKVTLKMIKDALGKKIKADEWHHTSKYGNRTDYWSAETVAAYFTPESAEDVARREAEEQRMEERTRKTAEIESKTYDAIPKEEADYWLENDYQREFPQHGAVFVTSNGDRVVVWRDLLGPSTTIDLIPKGENVARRAHGDWQYENWERVQKALAEYNEAKAKALGSVESEKQKSDTDSPSPSLSEHERITRDALIDLMRESGMEVITDVEEAQRVLDEENGVGTDLRLMGTRVESRKSEIAEALKDKELTEEQQAVVDVFTGKKDNQPITVKRNDGEHRIVMRQGNEQGAGTKHSIFGHYGTTEGVFKADDILRIPDVLEKGERNPLRRGKTQLYEYTIKGEDGTEYTVLTEVDARRESFADFYTNKKTSQSARKTRSEEARDIDNSDVSGAKLQKVSEPTKERPTFYSNAERAVEGIRQEKATPEQWLAMIQKVGGLKAGEDKWLGLSDWLKDSKEKTLTKQQVLDFINENMIEVEEVHYSETEDQELFADYKREYKEYYDQAVAEGEDDPQGVAWQRMVDEHGDDFELGFYAYGDELHWDDDNDYINYEKDQIGADRKINETRLEYTTKGVENKQEIALTVPTIEPWNERDDIHFGDAGEGRAVAWVRFGETTDTDGNRVLVIDEIQSKRHQEGRENGYITESQKKRAALRDFRQQLLDKYNTRHLRDVERQATEEELQKLKELDEAIVGVPVAPFEKNWHELAMKRMLRYAAENGYDKVAWTKGEQQAERYDLSKVIDEIAYWKEGDGLWGISAGDRRDSQKIDQQTFTEKELIETFGKEIAERILNDEGVSESVLGYPNDPNVHYLNGETIKIGGEGMKGFYDKMLPSFMNKYGKKWNVKVGEVELPEVEEAGRKMWSVDVTPEMKASVKEGQPMFFRTSDGTAYGFTTNGKIYIDPRIATSETPLHEYAHLWAQALRGASPKAWEQLKEQILGKEDVRQYVQRLYPELHGDSLAEEVFTTFAGRRGQQRLQEEREKMLKQTGGIFGKAQIIELFDRIRRAVRQFWNMARDLFAGRMPDSDLSRLSSEDFADMMTSDLMNGFDPSQIKSATDNIGSTATETGEKLGVNKASEALNERFSEREEEGSDRSLFEQQLLALDKLAESHKENLNIRRMAIEAMNGQMSRISHAMSIQKEYDKGTVDGIVRLARTLMEMNGTSQMTRGEVKKLLSQVRSANGKIDVTKQAGAVFDLLQKHQEVTMRNLLNKLLSVKGAKTNSSGVKVQGRMDARGEEIVRTMKESMMLDSQSLNERINDARERMESDDDHISNHAAWELTGLLLAKDYADNIRKSEAEDATLMMDLEKAKQEKKNGLIGKDAFSELEKEITDNIRYNRGVRLERYKELMTNLGMGIQESVLNAEQFRESERERANKIRHFANSDLQGIPANEHGGNAENLSVLGKISNLGAVRFFLKPLATFDEILRKFGEKSPYGTGYLWNRFMRGYVETNDSFTHNLRAAHMELDDKVSKVMGRKMRWSDLFSIERKMPMLDVEWTDGNTKRTFKLSQGNLLYIYMVNKMSDGRMKLRKMGITDEIVEQIKEKIDPRFVELGDWLQNDFLQRKGLEYAKVYEREFGTSMPRVENYFPLKINKNSRGQDIDVGKTEESPLASTITGSVIQRVRNTTALDLTGSNAFDIVLSHLEEMEHWAAYVPFIKDLNTLLSYKKFRNRVQNMNSLRFGSGTELWKNFRNSAMMVAGAYRPETSQNETIDKTISNIAKGVTQAKISFRVYTALKQLLSSPAYLSETSIGNFLKNNPITGGVQAWNWAIKNLPGFEDRWMSRQAGDSRLKETDMSWQFWSNKMVEKLSQWGMSPNAFVDALTVACGAKAMYESYKSKYLKDGYKEAEAERRALQDASISYNETQQSSEAAYLNTMQVDRTVVSNALTVFRNASMAYQRRFMRSLKTVKDYMKPGYKEEAIGFVSKQLERDGLDHDNAMNVARERVQHGWKQALADVAIFGFILQFAWDLGPNLIYLLFGDDDDKKKEILTDAASHALLGGVEGFSGGSMISDLGHNLMNEGSNFYGYNMNLLPLMSDMQNIIGKLGSDNGAALYQTTNLLTQSLLGLNPETITNWAVAIDDACNGDLETQTEVVILIARLMNAPESQIKELYIDQIAATGEEARQMPVEELARRYAAYKAKREMPLMFPLESKEMQEARIEKKAKTFRKAARERLKMHAPDWEKKLEDYKNGEYKQANKAYKDYQSGTSDVEPDWRLMERREIYKDYMNDIRILRKGGDDEEADELSKELVRELESIH